MEQCSLRGSVWSAWLSEGGNIMTPNLSCGALGIDSRYPGLCGCGACQGWGGAGTGKLRAKTETSAPPS